jgi:hypothetical protein
MTRALSYLFGPELYWIVICLGARMVTRRNIAADPAMTRWLDGYWAVLPLMLVPLTFAWFAVPVGSRWWLLLRVDLAIAVGLAIAATQYCEGMTYHDPSSGPGAGAAWMMILAFGYPLMILGTIVSAVIIWRHARTGA